METIREIDHPRKQDVTAARAVETPPVLEWEIPHLYRTLIANTPGELEGENRMRAYAQQISKFTREERTSAREFIELMVQKMIQMDASDMNLGGPACNERVWYRVNTAKRPHEEMGRYSVEETNVLLLALITDIQRDQLFSRYAIDFSYAFEPEEGGKQRRLRATVYFDNGHLAMNMRLIAGEIRPLRSLGFHPIIERGLMFRYVRDGLTLVTGVTGSGKSTTLDSIVEANNVDIDGQIIIIAQPIEYLHSSKKCIVQHREVGKDVPTFLDGIVQALRQDPDMAVIGEMRDPETIMAAMEMSDTGHKVFSTLHTASAVESIDRIVAEYPPVEQERVRQRLADTLRCIISLKLLPRVGGGRVLAKEVLWMRSSARAAIKNNNTGEIYQMIWEGGNEGQITMEQDLFRLVCAREITPEIALNFANNKRRLQQLMR